VTHHQPTTFKPGKKIRLARLDPADTGKYRNSDSAQPRLDKTIARLSGLQDRLYAENRDAVLVVLQGMDTSGKDGTVKHVMSGVNPAGVRVIAFKVPSEEEADHDFLWRAHQAMPRRGEIVIFNRSHYEDVLAARVHSLVRKAVWRRRYAMINAFERLLSDNGVTIVKFFLHISKDEQKRRLQERLKDPEKNWKFKPADLKERTRWDDYQSAYEDALTRCNTAWAPWHVVPADAKWYRNHVVAKALVKTLERLAPGYPAPLINPAGIRIR
jgi:PPK2 family polyphosphate:nucleotide phosphotransferase